MATTVPIQVKQEMAKRGHRISHYLWHGIRNSWERLSPAQKNAIKAIDAAWEPPRPAFDGNGNIRRDNDSGEDFLYMHRQMIAVANQILSTVGNSQYPKVVGWPSMPAPGDADYPVVPMNGFNDVKSDDYFNNSMKPLETRYKSKAYLQSVTLGQMGADLEFSIHNDMHMRWSIPMATSVGYRPNTPITQPVDTRWDNINYDFLGDTYSSHVHNTFWKIHGWVDDRIGDWKRANNVNTIHWTGTWVGPMSHPHEHLMTAAKSSAQGVSDEAMDKMIEAARVLAEVNFTGFLR